MPNVWGGSIEFRREIRLLVSSGRLESAVSLSSLLGCWGVAVAGVEWTLVGLEGPPAAYSHVASSLTHISQGYVPEHLTLRFLQKLHALLVRGYLSLRFLGRGSSGVEAIVRSAMISVGGHGTPAQCRLSSISFPSQFAVTSRPCQLGSSEDVTENSRSTQRKSYDSARSDQSLLPPLFSPMFA